MVNIGYETFIAVLVFIRQRKTKKEEESSDENPVYATYEVHYDPVAEVGIICCRIKGQMSR